MKTIEDLQAAFSGESQANRKYLAFAKKAEREGYPQVANTCACWARSSPRRRT